MFKKSLFFSAFLLSIVSLLGQITDPSPYCESTYHNDPFVTNNHISNVTINTLNNSSADGDYSFFNGFNVPLEIGMDYSLSVTLSGTSSHGYGVWIDYNQDSIFSASELVASSVNTAGLTGLQNTTITIPSYAYNDTTRMRVRALRDNLYFIDSLQTAILPCNSIYVDTLASGMPTELFAFGETEDYNIVISGACVNSEVNVFRFDYNGKDYHLVKENKIWEDASDCAIQRGGKLAQIESQEEQDAIHVQMLLADITSQATIALDGGGDDYLWLGGTDEASANTWRWDGNNDGYGDQFWQGGGFGSTIAGSYSNWGNAPASFGNREGLAIKLNTNVFGAEAEWVDLNMDDSLFYIIEYPKEEYGINTACMATYDEDPSNSSIHISNVKIEAINQNSGNAGYMDYADTITNLKAGLAYTLFYTVSGNGAHGVSAWLDYNANGVFELNEQIGQTIQTAGITPGEYTFGFNIPLTATLDLTLLRIRVIDDEDEFVTGGTTEIDPCLEYEIGETEDYHINMIDQGLGNSQVVIVTSFQNISLIDEDSETLQFFAQTNPTVEPVTWSITPGTGNATIDANGLLTPTVNGTVTIVASATIGGNNVEGSMEIEITNQLELIQLSHNGDSVQSICNGQTENFTVFVDLKAGFVGNITFDLAGVPANVATSISPTIISEDGLVSVSVTNNGAPFLVSDITFTATVATTGVSDDINLELRTFNGLPFINNLVNPENNEINVSQLPTLTWTPSLRADWFLLEIATDMNFTDVVFTENNIADETFSPAFNFLLNTEYFWRIQPQNPCGNGFWTETHKFRTQPESGILGCTDNSALNYNNLAAVEDGSCEYPIEGCTNSSALNYNSDAIVDDGSCVLSPAVIIVSPVNDTTFHFSVNSNIGTIEWITWEFNDGNPVTYSFETTYSWGENGIYPIEALVHATGSTVSYLLKDTIVLEAFGCTDPFALNFSIPATIDDGSCIEKVYGCTNPLSTNYNNLANVDDGSCSVVIMGCTDTSAFNFNASATNDDGSCIEKVFGCIDQTALNYDAMANTDDGSCIPTILGCMDATAYNYNADATVDDGSCEAIVMGCNNADATNYDSMANTDDGSCLFTVPNGNDWQIVTTSENHSILIQNTLDQTDLTSTIENGDFLGVFFTKNDGTEQCAGRVEWTGSNLALTVYGNETGEDNGFEDDEAFIWKLWKSSDNSVTQLTAEYATTQSHQGNYADDGVSEVLKVSTGITHSIELETGWNFISTNLSPVHPIMDSVFSSVNTDLFLAKDEAGSVYWPSVGVNNIGNHSIGEGYKVNMNADATLEIEGTSITPENYPITLNQGWSYIGYLRNQDANISSVMASVQSDIFLVKDIDGNVYWPDFGINNIGNMKIGKGYQINMNADTTFIFPSNSTTLPSLKVKVLTKPNYFGDIVKSSRHMHIGITEDVVNTQLNIGDEIAVYYKNEVIGAGVWNNENMVITIFGNENKNWDTKALTVKGYSKQKLIDFDVVTNIGNGLTFKENDILTIKSMSRKLNPNINVFISGHQILEWSNVSEINQSTIQVEVKIFDYLGRKIYVSQEEIPTGNTTTKLPELNKGSYLIQVRKGDRVLFTEKWMN